MISSNNGRINKQGVLYCPHHLSSAFERNQSDFSQGWRTYSNTWMWRVCGITYVTNILYLVKAFIKIVSIPGVKRLSNEMPVELMSLYLDTCEFSSGSEYSCQKWVCCFCQNIFPLHLAVLTSKSQQSLLSPNMSLINVYTVFLQPGREQIICETCKE